MLFFYIRKITPFQFSHDIAIPPFSFTSKAMDASNQPGSRSPQRSRNDLSGLLGFLGVIHEQAKFRQNIKASSNFPWKPSKGCKILAHNLYLMGYSAANDEISGTFSEKPIISLNLYLLHFPVAEYKVAGILCRS